MLTDPLNTAARKWRTQVAVHTTENPDSFRHLLETNARPKSFAEVMAEDLEAHRRMTAEKLAALPPANA